MQYKLFVTLLISILKQVTLPISVP